MAGLRTTPELDTFQIVLVLETLKSDLQMELHKIHRALDALEEKLQRVETSVIDVLQNLALSNSTSMTSPSAEMKKT